LAHTLHKSEEKPSNTVDIYHPLLEQPEEGRNNFLRNVSQHLPIHATLRHRHVPETRTSHIQKDLLKSTSYFGTPQFQQIVLK
jgi:hypothetical protein